MLSPSDQRDRLVADEVRADDERLGEAVGRRLDGVLDARCPSSEPSPSSRWNCALVLRGGDDEDLADAGHHQRRQRVVDHRLVVDRHQLLQMPLVIGQSRVPDPPARMMPRMVSFLPRRPSRRRTARAASQVGSSPAAAASRGRALGVLRRQQRLAGSAGNTSAMSGSSGLMPCSRVGSVDVGAPGSSTVRVVGRARRSRARGPRRGRSRGGRRRRGSTVSQLPKVGEPTRRSTTKSSTAPRTAVTYLAWPGGTSAKWMPRTTPRCETEVLACAQVERVPDGLGSGSKRYHSRNTPRSSPCCAGSARRRRGRPSGVGCTAAIVGTDRPGAWRRIRPLDWRVRDRPGAHVKILVTGGAGFIGSNFVRAPARRTRYPGLDGRRGRRARRAHLRGQPGEPRAGRRLDRATVRQGRHLRRRRCSTQLLPGVDAVVHFAAESHVDRSIARRRRPSSGPTCSAPSSCSTPRCAHGVSVRPRLHRRGLRLDRRGLVGRGPPARAELARTRRRKAGSDLLARGLLPHPRPGRRRSPAARTTTGRTSSPRRSSRCSSPTCSTASTCRSTATGNNVRDWLHVDDHCRGIAARARRRPRRRDLQHRRRHRADQPRAHRSCCSTPSGTRLVVRRPRRRPQGPRPALLASTSTKIASRARLRAAGAVRAGPGRRRRSGTATTAPGGSR